jgi:hypothetical protein
MFVFLLPFCFELFDDSISEKRITVFYVRKPPAVLEPRRSFNKRYLGQTFSSSEPDADTSVGKKAAPVGISPARIIHVME